MKFGQTECVLDETDLAILDLLQENCKRPLAAIGEKVGLTAPSVVDRIHKLEGAGVIRGYVALVEARLLGKDVTAFIGVSISHPEAMAAFESQITHIDDVLECHHVTGRHTLMVKVKVDTTASLEELIGRMRSIEGVTGTETMVVLSTHTERQRIALETEGALAVKRFRRPGASPLRWTAEPG